MTYGTELNRILEITLGQLLKFRILNNPDTQSVGGIDYPMLINSDHIVSIKPIKIQFAGNVIQGYWVRTSTGKKYKATQIPLELAAQLLEESDTELAPNLSLEQAKEDWAQETLQ